MAKKKNQTIGCNVESCKYNDSDCKKCTLDEIEVTCNCEEAKEKNDTICNSYSCGCKDEDE